MENKKKGRLEVFECLIMPSAYVPRKQVIIFFNPADGDLVEDLKKDVERSKDGNIQGKN